MLADYNLTRESIQEMDLEEFVQTCAMLASTDVVLLFRLLEAHGYDYWLQKIAFASPKNPKESPHFHTSLLEKLKEFVEVNFCEEKPVVGSLSPYQLRLLSKVSNPQSVLPPAIPEASDGKPEEEKKHSESDGEKSDDEPEKKSDKPKEE
jgi:hypothetical protein